MLEDCVEQIATHFVGVFRTIAEDGNVGENVIGDSLVSDVVPVVIEPEVSGTNCSDAVNLAHGNTAFRQTADDCTHRINTALREAIGICQSIQIADQIPGEGFQFENIGSQRDSLHDGRERVHDRDGIITDSSISRAATEIAADTRSDIAYGVLIFGIEQLVDRRNEDRLDLTAGGVQELFFVLVIDRIVASIPEGCRILGANNSANAIKGIAAGGSVAACFNVADGSLAHFAEFCEFDLGNVFDLSHKFDGKAIHGFSSFFVSAFTVP